MLLLVLCFFFSGDPRASFKELQSLLIERAPVSGRGNSNNNKSTSSGRKKALNHKSRGAGEERGGGGGGEVGGEPGGRQLAVVHLGKAACVAQTAP